MAEMFIDEEEHNSSNERIKTTWVWITRDQQIWSGDIRASKYVTDGSHLLIRRLTKKKNYCMCVCAHDP